MKDKNFLKRISKGSLFEEGMLLTRDEIYERVCNHSRNTNLNSKTTGNDLNEKNLKTVICLVNCWR
jgi:hypothetical protein